MASGSFNSNLGQSNNSNQSAADYSKEMRKTVESLMKTRFKNDPSKAQKEADDLITKLEKNLKAQLALDKKSAAERRKEERDAAKKIAELLLATATTTEEKRTASAAIFKENLKEAGDHLKNKLKEGIANLGGSFDGAIKEYASIYAKYQASIDARLQGSSESASGMFKLVRKNLAASPFVKQADMIDKLNELVSAGIAYNVEQRSFLASVSDKMVATFEVLDQTLLKMIRLQQADSTLARLGMEATLTQFLNANYKDTSYLSNLYDSVTATLFETSSQLGRNQSVEFEYVVQKWLGALSSVGVGDNTLTQIAEGLNYLGTGNVDALSSNTALQNLLVTAANRAGLEYSGLLTQGLNADTANKLLKSTVEYIQEIAQTSNQVVRAQYGQLFGVTMSDMVAILNIVDDVDNIHESMLSYSSALQETTNQLMQIPKRMHAADMVNNIIDNFKAGIAGNIASNPATYMMWEVIDWVEQLTGGINLPAFSVMGNMVDLSAFTVTGIMKSAMVGISAVGQAISMLSGLGNLGGLNLDSWGYEDTLRRDGRGFSGITSGYSSSTSGSAYVGSSNGSAMADQSVASAGADTKEEMKSLQDEEDSDPDSMKNMIMVMRDILQGVIHGTEAFNVLLTSTNPIPVSISNIGTTPTFGQ